MSKDRPTGWEGAQRWFASGEGADHAGGDPPSAPPACQVCGGELESDQTYCLECGSPTPLAPRLRRGGRMAAVLAGAMIVLGLGAGILAYALLRDDETAAGPAGTSGQSTPTAVPGVTTPAITVPPGTGPLPADTSVTTPTAPASTIPGTAGTTGFDTVTGPSGSTPGSTNDATPTPTPSPTPEPASADSDWPIGRNAWTAVLASVRSESDARSAKSRVAGGGDPAGVLFSSDYSELRAGYWVVFSGIYDSRNTAIGQAAKLRPEFPSAYARRIEG